MISIPSTSLRPDAHRRTIQESYQHWPFHIISSKSQLIALLKSPSNVHPSTRFVGTFTAVTLHCLGGTGPCHLIGTIFAGPHLLHGRRAAALKTRPAIRSQVFVTALTVFLAAAQDTPHQQPNSFPSGSSVPIFCRSSTPSYRCPQCLTRLEHASSPTSSRPWLAVARTTSPQCGGTSQLPTFVPRHDLQQSHSETWVCVLRFSSFVTNVFHQQTSRCSRALRVEF